MNKMFLVILIGGIFSLTCNSHKLIPFEQKLSSGRTDYFTQVQKTKLDILWVVDNSGSMCQEQKALAENFDKFIDGIAALEADLQIGIVTTAYRVTDIDDYAEYDIPFHHGRLNRYSADYVHYNTSCTNPDGSALIPDTADCPPRADLILPFNPAASVRVGPINNGGYDPIIRSSDYEENGVLTEEGKNRMKKHFRCVATVGTTGIGYEKGLEQLERAIVYATTNDSEYPENHGFIRKDAYLVIIIVTDENDCSDYEIMTMQTGDDCEYRRDGLIPTAHFIDFVMSLKSPPFKTILASVMGPDAQISLNNNRDCSGGYAVVSSGQHVRYNQPPMGRACCGSNGFAMDGYRYRDVVQALGEDGLEANVCTDSFESILQKIADKVVSQIDKRCLTQPPADPSKIEVWIDGAPSTGWRYQCGCELTQYCTDYPSGDVDAGVDDAGNPQAACSDRCPYGLIQFDTPPRSQSNVELRYKTASE